MTRSAARVREPRTARRRARSKLAPRGENMGFRPSSPSCRSAALLLGNDRALPRVACYTHRAHQPGGPGGRGAQNPPGTGWEGGTRHALFWGLIRQDVPVDSCRLGDGTRLNIEEFKV